MKKNYILWSNEFDAIDAIIEDLRNNTEYCECDDNTLYDIAIDYINSYIDDIRIPLKNKYADGDIICLANLGLWDGRHCGYKTIDGDLSSIFYDNDCNFCEWYIDKYNNLCFEGAHHDGNNYYTYRELKPNLSDTQKDNFYDKLYEGKATKQDITRYTRAVGNTILIKLGYI